MEWPGGTHNHAQVDILGAGNYFLIKHEQVMLNNPRTVLMVKNLNRFNHEEKILIQQKAQQVLDALDEI